MYDVVPLPARDPPVVVLVVRREEPLYLKLLIVRHGCCRLLKQRNSASYSTYFFIEGLWKRRKPNHVTTVSSGACNNGDRGVHTKDPACNEFTYTEHPLIGISLIGIVFLVVSGTQCTSTDPYSQPMLIPVQVKQTIILTVLHYTTPFPSCGSTNYLGQMLKSLSILRT